MLIKAFAVKGRVGLGAKEDSGMEDPGVFTHRVTAISTATRIPMATVMILKAGEVFTTVLLPIICHLSVMSFFLAKGVFCCRGCSNVNIPGSFRTIFTSKCPSGYTFLSENINIRDTFSL